MVLLIPLAAAVVITLLLMKLYFRHSRDGNLSNKHVIITGGSSGIGKAAAVDVIKRGANVTLVARDPERLEMARREVLRHAVSPDKQKVLCVPLDISENYDHVEKTILSTEDELGPVFLLINCAGSAVCGRLEDTSIEDIKNQVNLNLFGTLFTTRALIPRMKSRRKGYIVLVGSQASLLGIYGYGVYSSTKFALRGLAEVLRMECEPYNISVTIALPPDTDTPGFAIEERNKPRETKLISQAAGLFQPEMVAAQLVKDALEGKFFSTVGFESFMLKTLCCGMSPVSSIMDFVYQVLLMAPFRAIGVGYLWSFRRIIHQCMHSRDQTKKSE